jgi:hypothetical protein
MSRNAVRSQGAVTPTVTTVGVAATSDEVRTFTNDVRPCLVVNLHATANLFVRVNTEGATATLWEFKVPALSSVDVSNGGMINVKFVSLFGAEAYSNALVFGWAP